MAETLSAAKLDAVNKTRTELGLEPLTAAGFPHLDVDFLRRKAQEQLRDALGRWREMRGTLNPDTEKRGSLGQVARVHGLDLNWDGPDTVVHDPKWGQTEPPASPQKPAPKVLEGKDAAKALKDVGEGKDTQDLYEDGFAIITRDGRSMVAVPKPYVAAKRDLEAATIRLKEATDGLKYLEDQRDRFRANGMQIPRGLTAALGEQRAAIMNEMAKTHLKEQAFKATDPAAPLTPEQTKMATDALDELEEAVLRIPAWRQREEQSSEPARSFRIDLDESLFPSENVAGFTRIGDNVLAVNPASFYKHPHDIMDPGHLMPTGHTTTGRYTINHELGHMTDVSDQVWSSDTRPDVWEAAKATGQLSRYGYDSIYEGYAEAFAMWMSGQKDHPVAKMYAEAFGWDLDTRPDFPPASRVGHPAQPDYQPPRTEDEWDELAKVGQAAEMPWADAQIRDIADYLSHAVRIGDTKRLRKILDMLRRGGFFTP